MKYRQWKKNYKKKHGVNPPLELDKRKKRRLARKMARQINKTLPTAAETLTAAINNWVQSIKPALVYDGFYQMVQAEDELAELAKKRRSDIYIAESNTVIKPIAFNAKKSDGFNPQLVVCDEMAAWSGDAGLKQYEVMKSALGARTQPMILSISTAGYINDSIYDELMKRSTSFLKGNSKERRLLPCRGVAIPAEYRAAETTTTADSGAVIPTTIRGTAQYMGE